MYVEHINKNEENNSLTHNKIFIESLKNKNNLKSNNRPNFNFFHKESFISQNWFNELLIKFAKFAPDMYFNFKKL